MLSAFKVENSDIVEFYCRMSNAFPVGGGDGSGRRGGRRQPHRRIRPEEGQTGVSDDDDTSRDLAATSESVVESQVEEDDSGRVGDEDSQDSVDPAEAGASGGAGGAARVDGERALAGEVS